MEEYRSARMTICNADDTGFDMSHYLKREGTEARIPINQTEFRKAEREFKARTINILDNSTLIDFDNLDKLDPSLKARIQKKIIPRNPNAKHLSLLRERDLVSFEIDGFPGFVFIPKPFTEEKQKEILVSTFVDDMNSPNLSNLDAVYNLPYQNLWKEHIKDPNQILHLPKKKQPGNTELYEETEEKVEVKEPEVKSLEVTPEQLIRRIRWVTLGYHYNWTTKEYNFNDNPGEFPSLLSEICKETASVLFGITDYKPEAGIINYYQLKDSLTGHVDRSEKNMTAPLISLR